MIQTSTRKERDRLLREEDFLDAAERLFSERGYFKTSMEDVAADAEYATGTIYRYFSSKEDLYHRLLLRKGQAYFEEMRGTLAVATSPMDRLKALVRGKASFFFSNREFTRLYLYEVSRPPQGSRFHPPGELRQFHEQYLDTIRAILRDGMEEGVFRVMDLELALSAFLGLAHEVLALSLEDDFKHSEDDVVEFILGFLRGGLIKRGGRK